MRRAVVVMAAMAMLTVQGCGTPPWETAANAAGMPTGRPSASADRQVSTPPTPSEEPQPAPSPTPPVVIDDLAEGSITHLLRAGALVLTARYWSERGRAEWTAEAVKPLAIDVSAQGNGKLSLASVEVQVERLSQEGWIAVDSAAVTQPVVAGSPDIEGPASASTTVTVRAVEPDSYALRYTVNYTVTSSGRDRVHQAVGTDSITVALARPQTTQSPAQAQPAAGS